MAVKLTVVLGCHWSWRMVGPRALFWTILCPVAAKWVEAEHEAAHESFPGSRVVFSIWSGTITNLRSPQLVKTYFADEKHFFCKECSTSGWSSTSALAFFRLSVDYSVKYRFIWWRYIYIEPVRTSLLVCALLGCGLIYARRLRAALILTPLWIQFPVRSIKNF